MLPKRDARAKCVAALGVTGEANSYPGLTPDPGDAREHRHDETSPRASRCALSPGYG